MKLKRIIKTIAIPIIVALVLIALPITMVGCGKDYPNGGGGVQFYDDRVIIVVHEDYRPGSFTSEDFLPIKVSEIIWLMPGFIARLMLEESSEENALETVEVLIQLPFVYSAERVISNISAEPG
ncbi:MAG: hypothetical protein FWE31_02490 [Firmicutes bacterium]|nr:hypothetical protein [Bacillota bacterium]